MKNMVLIVIVLLMSNSFGCSLAKDVGSEQTFQQKALSELGPFVATCIDVLSMKKEAENLHLFLPKYILESARSEESLKPILQAIDKKRELTISALKFVKDRKPTEARFNEARGEGYVVFELNKKIHGQEYVKINFENGAWYMK